MGAVLGLFSLPKWTEPIKSGKTSRRFPSKLGDCRRHEGAIKSGKRFDRCSKTSVSNCSRGGGGDGSQELCEQDYNSLLYTLFRTFYSWGSTWEKGNIMATKIKRNKKPCPKPKKTGNTGEKWWERLHNSKRRTTSCDADQLKSFSWWEPQKDCSCERDCVHQMADWLSLRKYDRQAHIDKLSRPIRPLPSVLTPDKKSFRSFNWWRTCKDRDRILPCIDKINTLLESSRSRPTRHDCVTRRGNLAVPRSSAAPSRSGSRSYSGSGSRSVSGSINDSVSGSRSDDTAERLYRTFCWWDTVAGNRGDTEAGQGSTMRSQSLTPRSQRTPVAGVDAGRRDRSLSPYQRRTSSAMPSSGELDQLFRTFSWWNISGNEYGKSWGKTVPPYKLRRRVSFDVGNENDGCAGSGDVKSWQERCRPRHAWRSTPDKTVPSTSQQPAIPGTSRSKTPPRIPGTSRACLPCPPRQNRTPDKTPNKCKQQHNIWKKIKTQRKTPPGIPVKSSKSESASTCSTASRKGASSPELPGYGKRRPGSPVKSPPHSPGRTSQRSGSADRAKRCPGSSERTKRGSPDGARARIGMPDRGRTMGRGKPPSQAKARVGSKSPPGGKKRARSKSPSGASRSRSKSPQSPKSRSRSRSKSPRISKSRGKSRSPPYAKSPVRSNSPSSSRSSPHSKSPSRVNSPDKCRSPVRSKSPSSRDRSPTRSQSPHSRTGSPARGQSPGRRKTPPLSRSPGRAASDPSVSRPKIVKVTEGDDEVTSTTSGVTTATTGSDTSSSDDSTGFTTDGTSTQRSRGPSDSGNSMITTVANRGGSRPDSPMMHRSQEDIPPVLMIAGEMTSEAPGTSHGTAAPLSRARRSSLGLPRIARNTRNVLLGILLFALFGFSSFGYWEHIEEALGIGPEEPCGSPSNVYICM